MWVYDLVTDIKERVFEKSVLKKIFGPQEGGRNWRLE
jgi:hypothetical protein